MVPFHLNTTTLYSQSRKVNFDPFSYPSGKNDPIGKYNKTVRDFQLGQNCYNSSTMYFAGGRLTAK